MKKQKVLVLTDGTQLPVEKEAGKYYVCEGGVQFRKTSPSVTSVAVRDVAEPKTEEKPAPKKKSSRKAKEE